MTGDVDTPGWDREESPGLASYIRISCNAPATTTGKGGMRKGGPAVAASIVAFASAVAVVQTMQEYPVPKDAHPHDIAPAAAGHSVGWTLKLLKSATSRKGGLPGFVRVIDSRTLAFPDYDGNGMYRSWGNVVASPHAGPLFLWTSSSQSRVRLDS